MKNKGQILIEFIIVFTFMMGLIQLTIYATNKLKKQFHKNEQTKTLFKSNKGNE